MIYLIVKDKHNKIVAKDVCEQINNDGLEAIKDLIINIKSNYVESTFLDLDNNAIISLEKESQYFHKNFKEKLEELAFLDDFENIEIFENYIMYIFQDNNRKHIAFKGFESNIRIQRKTPKFSFSRNLEEKVEVHFKSANDISLTIDWDFKYVIDNYDDKKNKLYINQIMSINDFLIEPIENVRLTNFKKFEIILNQNGFYLKNDNAEQIYDAYMKYIPLYRYPDIQKIILNPNYIISDKNKEILSNFSFVDSNNHLHMIKTKHVIALLVDKIYKGDDGNWYAAGSTEAIEIPNQIESNNISLELVINN